MSDTVEGGIRLVRLAGTLLLCGFAALGALGAGIAAGPVAAAADTTCVGDCNANREVTVDELVTAVQIALGSRAVDDCLAVDPNLDRSVGVNELVAAVNSLLNGCPGGPTPVVSGTVTAATSTRTADATPGGPTSTPNPAGSPTATGSASTSGSPTSTPNPAGSPTATGSASTSGSPTSTPNPAGSPTATGSAGTAGSPTSTPNSIGTPTPTPAGATPGVTPTASPINTPPGTSDEKLPRLVGAASASNTTIIVQFSKQMSDSVKDPNNYVITQEHVNPEAGHLVVTAADFFNGDSYTVKLTTLSQNEVTYRLRVVNVRDVLNNPLAQIQVVGGVIVDSSSAVFPGTGPSCGPRTCSNGSSGVGGMGLCSSDADCQCPADAPPTCTQDNACPDRCELRDGDGDGVPDNVEQLGWVVTVHNTDGTTTTREVTGDPTLADSDGDGLDDKTELQIGTDPRRVDTDGDGLSDYEEYNVIYSDPTNQDTDGDGNDDKLEVEFFKTNPLLADSDGDGFSDSEELYQINRDPRIADLPQPDFSIGEVHLQIYEQFTYTDENGQTHSEDSSTETSLQTSQDQATSHVDDLLGGISGDVGIEPSACGMCKEPFIFAPVVVAHPFVQKETQDTRSSDAASQQAFQSSLDKAQTFSTDSTVTRQITGARVDVAVTFENKSDVAFTLSNLELTALTTDPQDSAKFIPLATLLPDGQQQSGTPETITIGPGQTRGPILFSNTQVFPNLVEELMKAPHGLIFQVANYDLTTGDGRNFAFGLQAVRERTVNVTVDFGDGTVKQSNAITAPVLNRPREEMRCAPGGDHPDYACASDGDCGTSTPCQGGQVIGGLSKYGGTGTPAGIPLDFVLRDIMHLRKTTPPVILAGKEGISVTRAQGDDVQVVAVCDDVGHCPVGTSGLRPDTVVVAPGRNGVLDTVPATRVIQGPDVYTSNVNSQGAAILAGPDGVADTVACPKNHCIQDANRHCLNSGDCVDNSGVHACIHPTYCDDTQVVAPGTRNLASDAIVVAAPSNGLLSGLLSTHPSGDDVISGPDGIRAGPNGIVESVAQGDDVQLVPVGTTGVPEDTAAIAAGQNGIIDTPHLGDDVADVVTGYEVSKTCDYNTLAAIVAGQNTTADTTVESGMCTTGFPPHFPGERGCRSNQDCGSDPGRPATCTTAVAPHVVGENCKADADCGPAGTPGVCTGSFGVCSSDVQLVKVGDSVANASTAIIWPRDGSSFTYVRSVPAASSDDQYVGPGIPCTTDLDCTVIVSADNNASVPAGTYRGSCSGPQAVVRVENRRNGQFRRFWAVLSNKTDIVQTDFSQMMVRPGDVIELSFIQDADRDGLIAQEEFLHATSDFNRDTDGDGLDDFEEIRLGWEVGAVGQALRRVFPDPRNADSDGDGLTDLEEKDLRRDQCACDAIGPKTLLGSGNLLRGQSGQNEAGGRPCASDAICGAGGICRDTVHCTYADYLLGMPCPNCDADQTLHRTDPRLKDTDGDRVSDFDEVFGYRTGTGIFSPPLVGGPQTGFVPEVVVTGNGVAHTRACPSNHCQEDAGIWCQTDGDCEGSHQCIHPVACDDVQVVAPGTGGLAANTVVVAPGPYTTYHGRLSQTAGGGDIFITTAHTHGNQGLAIDNNAAQAKALENAQPDSDDEQIVPRGQQVFDEASLQCADGSAFATAAGITGLPLRFAMCAIIKPGPDGRIETTAQNAPGASATSTLNNVLVPADSGQKIEVTDPLNPDTDGDEIADGFERILGSSPNDPTDTGLTADTDQDGLSDNVEKSGWTVSITGPHPSMRPVASNPYVQDTDGDGLPDYAELHMPCRTDLTAECPIDPTNLDTDGDGLSDYDELTAAQFARLESLNGFFAGYHIDGSASKKYGTDPNNSDTDRDGLSDGDEVLKPFYLTVPGESFVRKVFTNPLDDDTDHDGVKDKDEETRTVGTTPAPTDPTDPDTDGDQRIDGQEVAAGANPLIKDVVVVVKFADVKITGGRGYPGGHWFWRLRVQEPGQDYPGTEVSDVPTVFNNRDSCLGFVASSTLPCIPGCDFGNRIDIPIPGAAAKFPLRAGQGFVVNGFVADLAGCGANNSTTTQCRMEFLEAYTYESLSKNGFTEQTETLTGDNGCKANVVVEITVE